MAALRNRTKTLHVVDQRVVPSLKVSQVSVHLHVDVDTVNVSTLAPQLRWSARWLSTRRLQLRNKHKRYSSTFYFQLLPYLHTFFTATFPASSSRGVLPLARHQVSGLFSLKETSRKLDKLDQEMFCFNKGADGPEICPSSHQPCWLIITDGSRLTGDANGEEADWSRPVTAVRNVSGRKMNFILKLQVPPWRLSYYVLISRRLGRVS